MKIFKFLSSFLVALCVNFMYGLRLNSGNNAGVPVITTLNPLDAGYVNHKGKGSGSGCGCSGGETCGADGCECQNLQAGKAGVMFGLKEESASLDGQAFNLPVLTPDGVVGNMPVTPNLMPDVPEVLILKIRNDSGRTRDIKLFDGGGFGQAMNDPTVLPFSDGSGGSLYKLPNGQDGVSAVIDGQEVNMALLAHFLCCHTIIGCGLDIRTDNLEYFYNGKLKWTNRLFNSSRSKTITFNNYSIKGDADVGRKISIDTKWTLSKMSEWCFQAVPDKTEIDIHLRISGIPLLFG